MASVNKVQIIGNIGTESPEIRQVGQNTVAKFSVATSERFKRQDGSVAEETTWHRVELWGNTGVHPYLVRGTSVYVEGSYKTNEWTDQQGVKHRDYYIKAFTVQLLGGRPQNEQAAPAPAPAYAPAPPQGQPAYAPQTYQPRPANAPPTPPNYPAPPAPPAPPQYAQPPMPPQAPAPTAFPPQPSNSGVEDLPF